MTDATLELRGISKRYGRKVVLEGLDLSLPAGRFSVVLGPPAGGKSVLMRLLIGLEQPDAGQIFFRGEDVTARSAGERYFGYVPQSFALYPHYTVYENIAYPLTLARHNPGDTRRRVTEIAARLRIDHLLEKRPNLISGGEKQRVALARGVIRDAPVYVLDDPLVGLDFKLREQLFTDLRDMLAASTQDSTFIYTTSDPLETLAMADEVFVLDRGRVVAGGGVEEIYERPTHLRALQLLGYPAANTFPGQLLAGRSPGAWRCRTGLGEFALEPAPFGTDPDQGWTLGQTVTVGVRPEHLIVSLKPPPPVSTQTGHLSFAATETLREDLGAEQLLYLDANGLPLVACCSDPAAPLPVERTGAMLTVHAQTTALAVFDPTTGLRLGQGTA